MGTRHLIAVQIDGEYPIAQYGQWDGYPDGQGCRALDFLREEMRRDDLIAKAKSAKEMTQEMRSAELRRLGHDGADWVSMDVSDKYNALYPQLSRDTGSDILAMVQEGPAGMLLRRDISFAGESLMCEWAYVIDFDKNTFEVFEGFNKEPLMPEDRFYEAPTDGRQYYGVKKVAEWPLSELPDEEAFLASFKNDDEDEEAA